MEEKSKIRALLCERRDCMPECVRKKWSQKVTSSLFRLPEFQCARAIALFGSFRSEVFTRDMICRALSLKKRVSLPVTVKSPKRLIFRQIFDLDKDLSVGSFGIPEPKDSLPRVKNDEIELVVTPGIAFDRCGYRIGFGGGYYDRLFAQIKPECVKVGIAFHFQLIDKVPHEPKDLPVDIIVTDQTIIHCCENRSEKKRSSPSRGS